MSARRYAIFVAKGTPTSESDSFWKTKVDSAMQIKVHL